MLSWTILDALCCWKEISRRDESKLGQFGLIRMIAVSNWKLSFIAPDYIARSGRPGITETQAGTVFPNLLDWARQQGWH